LNENSKRELIRHEEELRVGTTIEPVGEIHAHKRIEVEKVGRDFPRTVEQARFERVEAGEGDNGQIETLPDGSVSIPLLEEELVVTKRVVVRERIVIRKESVVEHERVEAELRRERIEIEDDRSDDGGQGR
jgi:uncharacterized protein (TIGR02271 family)